jgi:hypothetical protein
VASGTGNEQPNTAAFVKRAVEDEPRFSRKTLCCGKEHWALFCFSACISPEAQRMTKPNLIYSSYLINQKEEE